ncbi:hypothetical protein D3C73_1337950 [compost metagenome]
MLVSLPIVIAFTSPLITALNQTEHLSPIATSPTIVAFSAIKLSAPICGYLSFTGNIKGIVVCLLISIFTLP